MDLFLAIGFIMVYKDVWNCGSVESCWHQCPAISHKKPFVSLPTRFYTSATHQLLCAAPWVALLHCSDTTMLPTWSKSILHIILYNPRLTICNMSCFFNNTSAYKEQSHHLTVCVVTDPILTIEIVPSFVPLTRVSHRNLRSRVYISHMQTHTWFLSPFTQGSI